MHYRPRWSVAALIALLAALALVVATAPSGSAAQAPTRSSSSAARSQSASALAAAHRAARHRKKKRKKHRKHRPAPSSSVARTLAAAKPTTKSSATASPSPKPTATSTSPSPSPTPTPASTSTATSAPSTPCGGAVYYKADGTRWQCSFDDEFSGTSLDTTKWTAWNGINYNTSPNTCYYDDPGHLWVSGGYLDLAVTRLASPASCVTGSGLASSTYGGALVHTKGNFDQTYGRFEARIKFAGGTGLHHDFWLYPTNNTYPGQAEIDIAEPYGAWPDTMNAVTHVTGAAGQDAGTWGPCTVTNWAGGFHTYAAEWTSSGVRFFYDGQLCMSFTTWSTLAGYVPPAPFNQPFFMILQSLADDGGFAPAPTASTVLPAVTQVDYVRAWK